MRHHSRGRLRPAFAIVNPVRVSARLLMLAALLTTASWAVEPQDNPTQAPAPGPIPPPESPTGLSRWFNPATAPFIPVPLIGVDPDSGTTVGLIPTWVKTDENHEIRRIIAPDVLYNPYFGYGVHGRVYGYTSGDEQWSVISGIKERVEREFDAEYQRGRLREERWSINTSVIYDRSGVPRFYGIGNESSLSAQTNYTNQQERTQAQVGLNLTHDVAAALHRALAGRRRAARDLATKSRRSRLALATCLGLGTTKQVLNRLSLVYDTRDDLTVPSRGLQLIAYGGLASRDGLVNDSMYSEVGGDGRAFWPIAQDTILACTHGAALFADRARCAVLGAQQHRRGRQRGRRRAAAARLRRRPVLRSRFLLQQSRAAPQGAVLRCHLDRHRCGIDPLHRCRPGVRAHRRISAWSSCTMSTA